MRRMEGEKKSANSIHSKCIIHGGGWGGTEERKLLGER